MSSVPESLGMLGFPVCELHLEFLRFTGAFSNLASAPLEI